MPIRSPGSHPPAGSWVPGSCRVTALYSTSIEFTSTTGESVPNASTVLSSSSVRKGHMYFARSGPRSRSGPPGSSVM